MIPKSVISLISYDAHLLPNSIKTYYKYVDEIILGLDENRITWSKNPFTFNESELWKQLKKIDTEDKIKIVEHNFHDSAIPLENDNFERNYLKSECSHDWIFSIDADEDLVNPKEFFVDFLPIVDTYYDKVELLFTWYLPFKQFTAVPSSTDADGKEVTMDITLVIAHEDNSFFRGDTQGFTTSKDKTFTYCRWTETTQKLLSPLAVMHWSFCRTKEQLDQKLKNFGHSNTINEDPFFHNWTMCDMNNYKELKNFKTSGLGGNQWEKLVPVSTERLMDVAKREAPMIMGK